MTKLNISSKTRIKTRHEMQLDGNELRAIINQELAAQGIDRIPDTTKIEFFVPGGGDWSSTSIDITKEHPIHISWTTVEEN